MRILSVRVKDYRGLAEAGAAPAPLGITVLRGPNEAGKSSLAQAVDLLFDPTIQDSSRAQRVQSAQPAGRDVGPEITVEAESGPYAFTYRKRYLKKPETELHLSRPRPEHLTGREAHDRVQAILAETADLDLWRALRIDQGAGVRRPELGGRPALLEALERAAGGSGEGDEEDLFTRVRKEYEQYYTAGRGQEKKLLKDARAEAEAAATEAADLAGKLEAVERDAERRDALERTRVEVAERLARAREEAGAAAAERKAVDDLSARLDTLRAGRDRVVAERKLVQEQHRDRLARVEERDRAASAIAEREGRTAALESAAAEASERAGAAEAELDAARRHVEAAERMEALRKRDLRFREEEAEREALEARLASAAEAAAEAEKLEGALAGGRLDAAGLEAIEAAALEVERARAALAAGAPRVSVEALGPLRVQLDEAGEESLAAGERRERSVERALRIEVPDTLRITVEAGGDAATHAARLDGAEAALARALAGHGAESVDAARALRETTREREAHLAEFRRARDRALGGEREETLRERTESLRAREQTYFADRPAEPPIAGNAAEAREARDAAEAAVATARNETRRLEEAAEPVRQARDAARRDLDRHREELERLAAERERAETQLAAAREARPDEALFAELNAIKKKQMELDQEVYDREAELGDRDPEAARARDAEAADRVRDLESEAHEVELETRDVATRLDVMGVDGLFDRAEEARGRAEAAARKASALERRGRAARALFQTLAEERDRARKRYQEPLRERIENLGRPLFGPGFAVELDETLQVARRTLDGVTLPFEDLSMGAQEQVSVLTRLAAALLVSETEGMPLILDDALGYSDPDRLRAMASVLDQAGKSTQILVLTCFPERYRHLTGAKVISLG